MANMFLKFTPEIQGDSTDDKHQNWIEIYDFKHTVSQPTGGPHTSAGHLAAGRSIHTDFKITKRLDRSSPALFLYCCKGTSIGEAKIEICREQDKQTVYATYTFKDLIVSSVTPSGTFGKDGNNDGTRDLVPMEEITLRYSSLDVGYTPTKRDGSTGASVEHGWDIVANKQTK